MVADPSRANSIPRQNPPFYNPLLYIAKALEQIMRLKKNNFICPKTGKKYVKQSAYKFQLFLEYWHFKEFFGRSSLMTELFNE